MIQTYECINIHGQKEKSVLNVSFRLLEASVNFMYTSWIKCGHGMACGDQLHGEG